VDFARDPSNPKVLAPVRTFLHEYVESAYKERVLLGHEERAMVRTVNSAYSVIEVWRRLVAAADFNVLRVERAALRRNDQAQKASRLVLKWEQEGEKREGPAYSIVKVYTAETTLSLPFPCTELGSPCMLLRILPLYLPSSHSTLLLLVYFTN
jgi:hypothetical protein